MHKISVCIICYNQEQYIFDCLNSVIEQTGNFELEVVIRDDCSTDGTRKKCEQFIREYGNKNKNIYIKLLDSDINIGANKNILQVLKYCTGDFIAFCEGDDYWCDIHKLDKQLTLALKNPEVDFYVHPAFYRYTDGRIEKKHWPLQNYKRCFQSDIFKADWQFAPTSSYFVRSNRLNSLPKWFENATIGDIYLEVYFSERGIIVLNEYLSVYRYLSSSSWSLALTKDNAHVYEKKIRHYKNYNECLDRVLNDYPELKIGVIRKQVLNNIQLIKAFLKMRKYKNVKSLSLNILRNDLYHLNLRQVAFFTLGVCPKFLKLILNFKRLNK
uniref:glycosyltransferase family 2 protein n=1 Tax=Scandinavium goeteborgense TaxID=1851514 RepID=UPI00135AA340|nr:glycosyltransferase [Scandinavium goeteborgense]